MLIDTSYTRRGFSGTSVYIEQLVSALRERPGLHVATATQRVRLGREQGPGRLGWARSGLNAVLDGLWLHVGLPRAARLSRADLVHHPLPAHSRRIHVPQVCTVHDLAFIARPAGYGRLWRVLAKRAYRRAARRGAGIVCPSEASARDAITLLGADPERVLVAPHGPGQVVRATTTPEASPSGASPSPTGPLVFVGDAEERKNLRGLLDAYALYRSRTAGAAELVLAGRSAERAVDPGVSGRPALSSKALLALLGEARALVQPSAHEGFGLTPLEAMALGVPVLAVATPATREICGDAALLVETDGLADGMGRIASDSRLRTDLARRGRERAAGFSWSHSARLHERAYTLAIGGSTDPSGTL